MAHCSLTLAVHHMMLVKKVQASLSQEEKRYLFCVGAVNAEAFRFISSALVLCRQAAALHEVQLHASTFTAAVLIGVNKYIGIAEPCHSVRTDRCTQVPCHVWGC